MMSKKIFSYKFDHALIEIESQYQLRLSLSINKNTNENLYKSSISFICNIMPYQSIWEPEDTENTDYLSPFNVIGSKEDTGFGRYWFCSRNYRPKHVFSYRCK